MINTPLVSIIIPVYKNVKWLQETINSILNQGYNNYEIIVVNDCSPENVEYFIKQYKNLNNFYYYKNDINKGISYTRNFGISKCNGQYILPIDSDDIIHDTNLLIDSIKKINEETVVSSQHRYCDINMKPTKIVWPKNQENDWLSIINENSLINSCMYPKSMWGKIGGYDEKILGYEDWEFWIRAYKAGYKLIRINHAYIYYRIHNDNITLCHNSNREKILKYIFDKHCLSER
jgi:glycosyltransferase involved in cell wall biosynthesis